MKNKKKTYPRTVYPSINPNSINPGDYYRFFHPETITRIWNHIGKPAMSYLPIRRLIDTKIREQKGIES